jgi:hypothetical protein
MANIFFGISHTQIRIKNYAGPNQFICMFKQRCQNSNVKFDSSIPIGNKSSSQVQFAEKVKSSGILLVFGPA